MHWQINRRHFERSSTSSIQGPPGHIGLGRLWILAWAYDVNVVDEYIFRPSSYDSSGQHMTPPSTASLDHKSTLPLLLLHPTPNALLGDYTGQFFKVVWSARALSVMPSFLYLAPHGNNHVLSPLPPCYSAHSSFYFLSFGPACISQSNGEVVHRLSIFNLLEQKYDHDYCPDWNQRTAGDEGPPLWLMKNGKHSTIAEDRTRLQATSMRYEEQEFSSFKHCMKVNRKKCMSQRRQIAWTSVFCGETYIVWKHQTANVWLYPNLHLKTFTVSSSRS